MSVGRVCVREVDLAEAHESVQVAAERMNSRKVGTLVVFNDDREPLGIITDRDLAVRVVARGWDPRRTCVRDVMTRCPTTVNERTPIEDALAVMRSGPFRRIPVVDNDQKLVGLLSIDDVLDLLSTEFGQIRDILQQESPVSLSGF